MNNINLILRSAILIALPILIFLTFQFFDSNIYWNYYQLHWDVALFTFLLLLSNLFIFYIISRITNKFHLSNIFLPLVVTFIILISFSSVREVAFLNLIFIFFSLGVALFTSFFFKSIAYLSLNYLVSIVFMQIVLLLLSFFNLLQPIVVLTLFFSISVFGFLLNLKYCSNLINKLFIKISFIETISILILSAIFFYSFILTTLPQTQSDGLVYRLTFLEQIKNIGTIPFHNYLWDWVTPQAMKLVLVPGYFFSGEYGASTQIFIFFIVLSSILYRLFIYFISNKELALIFSIVILGSPVVWVYSFSIFFEIPILCFVFGGILSLLYFKKEKNNYYLFFSALLFGFSILIKINVLLFISIFTLVYVLYLLFDKKLETKDLYSFLIGFVIFLFVVIPWLYLTFLKTGNPLFPFLPNLFPGTFIEANNFISPKYIELFYYPLNILSIFSLPIDLFYNGIMFHSFDGATNVWPMWLFLPLLPIVLLNYRKISGLIYSIIIAAIATIVLTHFFSDNILILRYWLHAYVGLVVISLILFEKNLHIFTFQKYISFTFRILILIWSIIFLSIAGIRINFDLNLGHEYFWDKSKLNSKIDSLSYGIPSFINNQIKSGESVAVTGNFYFVHRLDSHAYFMWYKDDLFGNVSDLEKTKNFIKSEDIRFWIIDTKEKSQFLDKFYNSNFLSDEKIVYGNDHFLIYDLKNFNDDIVNTNLFNPEFNEPLKLDIPSGSYWMKSNFVLDAEKNDSTVIIKKTLFNNQNEIVSELYEDRVLDIGENLIYSSSIINNNEIKKIEISIYPWRENIDGNFDMKSGNIKFFKKK